MIEDDKIIYLDNNATTELDPAVVEEMLPFLTTFYGNPSSGYRFGTQVRAAIDLARERVAALLGCQPAEIVFTGSGTEANNTAMYSALQLAPERRHVVTTAVEHSSVLRHCEELTKRGYEVTFLGVDEQGALDLDEVDAAIRADTAMVSVMWANNETGVLFPVEEIAAIARRKGAFFHTDAVQAAGKVTTDLGRSSIHSLALAGHKLHGPKGVGALYVNRRSRFQPLLIGGGHENGRRAGTENVASIVGLGKAAECAVAAFGDEATRVRAMRDEFESQLLACVRGTRINGDPQNRLPNTANLSFSGIQSEGILIMLDQRGICCSAGSACKTGSLKASHVLQAMHLDEPQARGAVRFSFGRFNSQADLTQAVEIIPSVIAKLRALSPGLSAEPVVA